MRWLSERKKKSTLDTMSRIEGKEEKSPTSKNGVPPGMQRSIWPWSPRFPIRATFNLGRVRFPTETRRKPSIFANDPCTM